MATLGHFLLRKSIERRLSRRRDDQDLLTLRDGSSFLQQTEQLQKNQQKPQQKLPQQQQLQTQLWLSPAPKQQQLQTEQLLSSVPKQHQTPQRPAPLLQKQQQQKLKQNIEHKHITRQLHQQQNQQEHDQQEDNQQEHKQQEKNQQEQNQQEQQSQQEQRSQQKQHSQLVPRNNNINTSTEIQTQNSCSILSEEESSFRFKGKSQLKPFSGMTLQDVFVFASKQLYARGFKSLESCYLDLGFDLKSLDEDIKLFKEVDNDKDGRLGIADIFHWSRLQGLEINRDEVAAAVAMGDNGFLSKLDFVLLLQQREMKETSRHSCIEVDDLVWVNFVALDANRDGRIGVEDIRRFCRPLNYSVDKGLEKMIRSIASGQWTFEDLKSFMTKGCSKDSRTTKKCSIL